VRSPEELQALFRASGRKVTAQRQCIFRVLHGDDTHPTAEAVHEAARRRIGTISLKTVYQTLHELADLGEIAVLDLGTGTARFDPNVDLGHHHLVCRSCGKVRDLHADFSAVRVPEGAAAGFQVGPAEVVFRGRCAECRVAGDEVRAARARQAGGGAGTAPRSDDDDDEEELAPWLN
jgi:Fe2+ or Zn2+ uptake regulation protein